MKAMQLLLCGALLMASIATAGCSIDDTEQFLPCITDAQCPEGLACSNQGICLDPDLIPRGDEDIDGDADDQPTGPCIDDDTFAPNRNSSEAAVIDHGIYEYLRLCTKGDDWFQIDLTDSNLSSVALYLRSVSPHVLGLGIKIYDEDMNFILSASHDEDGDIFRWVCENGCSQYGSKLYMQVVPEAFVMNFADLNRYHITVLKGKDSDMCEVDEFEPDNMELTAFAIEEGRFMHSLCPNDIDYMKFQVPARQHVDARLVFSATGSFEAIMYDQDTGAALLTKTSADTMEMKISAASNEDRNMLLMVRPLEDVPPGWYYYVADLDLTYVPPATCRDDALEPNNNIEEASINLFPLMLYNLSMCPGNTDDFFMASNVPGDTYVTFIASKIDGAEGELKVTVYDNTGTKLEEGNWGADASSVNMQTGSRDMDYYVQVSGRELGASGLGYELQGFELLVGDK